MEASQATALLAAAKERKARANARALSVAGGLHPSNGHRPEKPLGETSGGGWTYMQYTDYMHIYVYMYRLYTMWFRVCGCHHCRLNTPDVSYEILHDCFPKSDLINL